MKLHGSFFASLALGAVVALGCNKPAETNGPATTGSAVASATGTATAPIAAGKPGKHHGKRFAGRGPSAMLFRAAHQQTLTEAQQTKLDEASKSLKGDDASPRDEMKKLHDVMVEGVKAGKIDTAKFDAARAEVDKAMTARRDMEAGALNTLHATLDPAQRKAVVASARDKIAKREQKMGKWKDKMGDGPGAAPGKGPGPGAGPGGHGAMMIERMTADLGLDDAQKKKVEALVAKQPAKTPPDREAMKKQIDDLLTAFEGDSFDAKKLDAFSKPMDAKMGHMDPAFVTELLAILKPEQREKLAAKLEKGPPGMMGGMMGGKMGGKMGGPMHPPGPMGPPPGGPMPDDDDDDDDDKPSAPAPKTP
ncbi:MAG: periplasmic heavy metal sensor [Deltaproteobacteria bacterium]|nr:periplasmic heavy metal sensor [Deltaproteobacteria bacterium]